MCPRCARRYRAGESLDCPDCEGALQRSVDATGASDTLQPKLAVGLPGTAAEREAERVATDVASGASVDGGGSAPAVSRTATETGEAVLDGDRERQVRSVRSGGRRLPPGERSFFEARFGRDFSDVRVHTGPEADAAARSIDAAAFTLGSDVAFASGNYRPGTERGRRLLAHELTHVVQQGGGSARRAVQRQERRMTSVDLTSPRFEEQGALERVLDGEKILRRDDEGPAVFRVQQALVEAGLRLDRFGVDGIYGDETAAAVMRFQRRHGLQVDGVVGPVTMHALDRRYPEPDAAVTPGGRHTASFAWSEACLLDTFCEWNEPVIKDLRRRAVSLETFSDAYVKMWEYGENGWEETKLHARGYAKRNSDTIGLREDLGCYEAAVALYQEWFHIQQPSGLNTRQLEGRAWRAHETWLLDQGMPATESGFRREDPETGRTELDVSAVYAHVESNYYGASDSEGSVVDHDKDTGQTKVEFPSGATKWRDPQEGDKHRYGQEIIGLMNVDTSDWTCEGF
jgi:peptidoglycan hydrolase-like protein with peptidoglycan-binding domain